MRKRSPSARHAGLAILAGALTFMGNASAGVTIFSEGFEGGPDANIFGVPTYAYSAELHATELTDPGGWA